MRIMEDTSQKKEEIDYIQTEQHDTNHVLQRPKSFSLRRRSEAYYFSNNSKKGILKRVPFKNGSYEYNELETVPDKPDAKKIRNEIWSDVPLDHTGGLKADKNRTSATNEDSYEAIHHEQKNDKVLKSPDETTGIKLLAHDLKNLAVIKDYKGYLKHKNDDKKQLRVINQGQKEESFYKSFQRPKEKKYQTNVSVPANSEKFKSSDEKYEKLSASNMNSSSSKKSDEHKDESLNPQELNLMQMKTPITEL